MRRGLIIRGPLCSNIRTGQVSRGSSTRAEQWSRAGQDIWRPWCSGTKAEQGTRGRAWDIRGSKVEQWTRGRTQDISTRDEQGSRAEQDIRGPGCSSIRTEQLTRGRAQDIRGPCNSTRAG